MALADNAARAAAAAKSVGGNASKAAKASATNQTAFKVTKPATTKPVTKPVTKPATTKPATTKPATTKPATTNIPSSIEDILGLGETSEIQDAQGTYDAGKALREFQRQQVDRQLKDALGEIDRSAISNYKDIANDYAARGMARSGGFMGAESEAMASKTRADQQAQQAVRDFLAQLGQEDINAQGALDRTTAQIVADYLARRFAPAQGG